MDKFLIYLIPIYLVAIFAEYFSFRKQGKYNLKDTVASLSMGIGFLVISSLCQFFVIPIFQFLNVHSLFQIQGTWVALFSGAKITVWPFIVLLFADDFVYYWFHRASHEIRFFWCAHETHHSSEFYNFGTALRQTWLGSPFTWIFWSPLALLGFRVEDIMFQISLNLFYQFWVHTEYTKRLGFLDYVMNTPSYHRVHHATNLSYLDKNYAGIFIIWDKIFGTFVYEKEPPKYGVLKPVNSFNPMVIGLHMIKDLFVDIKQANIFWDKIKLICYPPGWKPDGTGMTTKKLQNNKP